MSEYKKLTIEKIEEVLKALEVPKRTPIITGWQGAQTYVKYCLMQAGRKEEEIDEPMMDRAFKAMIRSEEIRIGHDDEKNLMWFEI